MFDYLVTSKARRRLLLLLWKNGASGSVSSLSKQARVAYANAHRELRAMKLLGLVCSTHRKRAEVFRANKDSPYAQVLRAMMKEPHEPVRTARSAAHVRGGLRTLGAPLHDSPVAVYDTELALVQGVALSHNDPTVARVLPLCFCFVAGILDVERLLKLARDGGEKQAVGFFLDLTATLTGTSLFKRWAARFRDARCGLASRDFFPETSTLAREAARQNTPKLAKKWGLRMNMGLDAFQSMYEKHVHA